MTRRHRSAVSGQFASAEDAAAAPDQHVAETIRATSALWVERMNDGFEKLHLGDGRVAHRFGHVDGPEADYHDHPWPFTSTILAGGYVEEVMDLSRPADPPQVIERRPGDTFRNEAGTIHRIILALDGPIWTVIVPGPAERKPGFYRFIDGQVLHRFWDEAEFIPAAKL